MNDLREFTIKFEKMEKKYRKQINEIQELKDSLDVRDSSIKTLKDEKYMHEKVNSRLTAVSAD